MSVSVCLWKVQYRLSFSSSVVHLAVSHSLVSGQSLLVQKLVFLVT